MRRRPDDDVELETANHALDAYDLSDITLIPVALPSDTTSEEARGFLVAAVTLALVVFDLAFNLGVYGDVFFDHYLTVWAIAVTVILASLILPERQRPVGCGGAAVLALPSLYFPGAALTTFIVSRPLGDGVLHILGILAAALISLILVAAYVISLPFVMLTLARILDPTIIEVPTVRMRVGLFFIAVIMAVVGGMLGMAHPWWLTCDDFTVAGSQAPEGCTPVVIE